MRASDAVKRAAYEPGEKNHDALCLIASRFVESEDGQERIARWLFEGPSRCATTQKFSTGDLAFCPAQWEFPVVQDSAPKQFSLKGFCDLAIPFSMLESGTVEKRWHAFIECKPTPNIGEAIRQLRFYRHHHGKPCQLILATFERLDDYIDAFDSADIDLWTFIEDDHGWRLWSY